MGKFFRRVPYKRRYRNPEPLVDLAPSSVDWRIWRIVISKHATLQEIETHWSIDDLCDANEALDVKSDIEHYVAKNRQDQNSRA